jgi:hypothetical protein
MTTVIHSPAIPSSQWEGKWPFAEISLTECSLRRPFPSVETREKLNRTAGFEALACEGNGILATNDWDILVVVQTTNRTTGYAYARWGVIAYVLRNFFEVDGSAFGANAETVTPAKVTIDAHGRWTAVAKGMVKC